MRTSRNAQRDAMTLWRRCIVHGRPDPGRVREVVDVLLDTGRRESPDVLASFLRLVRLDAARWSARVESAMPLEAADRTTVRGLLMRRYGAAFDTTFAVDASLIGGLRLTIGNAVYDGTIRARLAAIDAAL